MEDKILITVVEDMLQLLKRNNEYLDSVNNFLDNPKVYAEMINLYEKGNVRDRIRIDVVLRRIRLLSEHGETIYPIIQSEDAKQKEVKRKSKNDK